MSSAKEIEPVAKPPLVEQLGLRIEEFLDLGLQPIISLRARELCWRGRRRLGGKQGGLMLFSSRIFVAGFAGTGPP